MFNARPLGTEGAVVRRLHNTTCVGQKRAGQALGALLVRIVVPGTPLAHVGPLRIVEEITEATGASNSLSLLRFVPARAGYTGR
jgi:hypothetical protein